MQNVSSVSEVRLPSLSLIYTVKKAARNSDVDIGGANQTTRVSEISYSHVLWFCATVVNIGIWPILTWLFYSVL
jgi:hypothetical protein